MKTKFSLIKWFKNVSVTKKLYFVVGVMALLITIELFTLWFSLTTLSSVRAFVGGEGLWSKAQKDAVYNLQKYARTLNNKDYAMFQDFMKVPLGDHITLVELLKDKPNMENARRGFIEGRNHPNDIDGMIKLFKRFHNISYIKKAIIIWIEADSTIMRLIPIGEELHAEVNSENVSRERINKIISKIDPINQYLTMLEDDFSYTLGEGARWLEYLILTVLFIIALTVEFSGLFLSFSISMGISKGINEIMRVSKKVSATDFSDKAKVYSTDEIGLLAISFNEMINSLESSVNELLEAQEQINRQQKLYESLVNAQSEMGQGVVITENDKIIYTNDALYKMYGYTKEEFLNVNSFIEFIIPEEREKVREQLTKYLTEESEVFLKGETSIAHKDGHIINIEYSLKIIKMNSRTLVLSVIWDITNRKQAEEELRHNAEELIRSNNDLEQFAYIASHDLREPLRTVSSYVQLLEMRYRDKLDNEANEFITYTIEGVHRMDKLINDLLLYSRVKKTQETKWVNCSDIVKTVLTNISDIIRENKVNIIIDKLPRIKSNPLQVTQLFQNLIVNAIKFQGNKQPEIHISSEEKETEWLFCVQDNGIGIDEKYTEKIFTLFQRLHTRKEYEGTGIGLAICKKIVEQHGGKIWFKSRVGHGSSFYFTIKK